MKLNEQDNIKIDDDELKNIEPLLNINLAKYNSSNNMLNLNLNFTPNNYIITANKIKPLYYYLYQEYY